MDLPVDAGLGLQRAAHVEAITGLEEIDPDFTFATCTVKIISTPCASGAQPGAEFNNYSSPNMKLPPALALSAAFFASCACLTLSILLGVVESSLPPTTWQRGSYPAKTVGLRQKILVPRSRYSITAVQL